MKRILITGSNGFVGKALTRKFADDFDLICAVRKVSNTLGEKVKQYTIGELTPCTEWAHILTDVDIVIHLAARVHMMNDKSTDPLKEFLKINTDSTLNLARQAADAGVKRFIFLSSIKVNGESTFSERPFKADDDPAPSDFYAHSKYLAEQGLFQLSKKTEMDVVVIRPPLIYGPGVKANFYKMMLLVNRGILLPFGSINSFRSLVAINNLLSLISICLLHPSASNQVFLVSDDEDITTTELLKRMGITLGKKVRLVCIPEGVLAIILRLIRRGPIAQRLCSSLQVDISKTKKILDWKPVVNVDDALQETADDFLKKMI